MVYPILILIPSPSFVKKSYTNPFTNVQRITLGSAMYIKVSFRIQWDTIMKIMIVNSKTKQKLKIILGVIRNLVLDFILYFVDAYIL